MQANETQTGQMNWRERRERQFVETIDWLALWALSIGFSAVFLAGLAFYTARDSFGASMILFGAATIIALALRFSEAPGDRS
jgi:hypothetical protein